MLQPQTASSCSNTQYATATTEDAPYAHKQLQIAESNNLSPRAQKRKRVDEPDLDQTGLADHLELCDLLITTNLPLDVAGRSAAARAVLQKSGAKLSRDAPEGHTLMTDMNQVYQLAHQRMLASVQPGQSVTATTDNTEYGPYHAQYWSMVSGSLDAGVPVPSNGGYQSPYGTAGPEAYYHAATANQPPHESFSDLNHANGYDHPDGSIYTLARNPQFATSMPQQQDLNTVYPSPVDNLSWNYFSPGDADPQNLSTLDHIATQLLNVLLSRSMDDVMTIFTQPDTPSSHAFFSVQNAFEAAVRQMPRDSTNLFISIDHLRLGSSSAAAAPLKANLAIFATSLFKSRDIPFLDLNAAFLDMFMPAGTRLLLNEGSLFLELKTQAFMALSMQGNDPRTLLEQLFPQDLQLKILRRRSDSHHLVATEQDFISRYNSRRQHLASCCDDRKALNQLPSRYAWHDLLTEMRICVDRALEQLERSRNEAISPGSAASTEDPIARAALAAHAAISQQEPLALLAFTPPSEDAASNWSIHERNRSMGNSSSLSPESPYSSMHLQYRNHIQAPPVKPTSYPTTANPPTKRHANTHPNTRRPWTPDEEKALMDGLERVKGPHWSQILALYGAGGSISEILKERNQVQLKDKARNLKLFFLKSGMPVPSYLQKVTGELKTRAPAQAAKMEAREKMKKMEEAKGQADGD